MASERLSKLDASSGAQISARVPLSLHPDQVSTLGPILVDSEGSGPTIDAYAASRFALRALYDSAKQIDAAHQSVLKPTPIVGAQYAQGSKPVMRMQVPPGR